MRGAARSPLGRPRRPAGPRGTGRERVVELDRRRAGPGRPGWTWDRGQRVTCPFLTRGERSMAVPKKKTSKAKSRSRRASNWVLRPPGAQRVPAVPPRQGPAPGVPELRVVQGPAGRRDRLVAPPRPRPEAPSAGGLPVAVDAMGGDRAPGEIVAGARRAADELGIPVVLVGPPDADRRHRRARGPRPPPRSSPWTTTPAVGAPQEGLLARAGGRGGARRQGPGHGQRRQHRRRHGERPAAHGPAEGGRPSRHRHAHPAAGLASRRCCSTPGANAECTPAMLVQFAQMGAAYATARYGVADPTVALLSIGEEKSKGTPLVKETHALLAADPRHPLRRQRRGARPAARRRRRGRDRRVHRQRGAQDPRGLAAVLHGHPARGVRRRRGDQDGRRGDAAPPGPAGGRVRPRRHRGGRCCSGWTGCASSATARPSATAIVSAVRVAHDVAAAGLVDRLAAQAVASPA